MVVAARAGVPPAPVRSADPHRVHPSPRTQPGTDGPAGVSWARPKVGGYGRVRSGRQHGRWQVPALGRSRRRHRGSPAAVARPRRAAVVDLPEAPGSAHRPAPLVLPVTAGRPAWHLPGDADTTGAVAVVLAVLDLAPPGALLDLVGDAPEAALLAAVYGTRLVRAVASDGLVAHAARQAAATNALPVVVEHREIGAGGVTLDDYAATTAIEPAVLRLGPGVDVAGVLAGAGRLLAEHRPWIVVSVEGAPAQARPMVDASIAQSYGLITEMGVTGASRMYVLAPEAAPAALAPRAAAWAGALSTAVSTAAGPVLPAPESGVVDLRDARGATRPVR
jgi:hypothetical protein